MKKILLVIGLILMSGQSVYATPTGNELVNQWKEYQMSEAEQAYSSLKVGFYIGYVSGVSDTGNGRWCFLPTGITTGQLCSVVGKWIEDHPERWTDRPFTIVTTALRKAFPLPKK